ncbi:RICIN domain-containing protein [Nakamurella sp. GG22]
MVTSQDRRWRDTAIKVVVMVLIASGVLVSGQAEATTGPVVSSWVTTGDRGLLLAKGGSPIAFTSSGGAGGATIRVDARRQMQTVDGFGASITDSSARVLSRLPADERDRVMTSLFSPSGGIGLSLLRQPLGSSDFVEGDHYTFDDLPAGQTDPFMTRFSIARDEEQILPLLRQARRLNPALKVIATPWGQPAWMKANRSSMGGRLINDPRIVTAYARYLLKSVQAYEAAGVPIYALTVQNEPQNRRPDGYPGTDMPVATEAAVINQLGPMLHRAGLSRVKLIGYDHNWAEHPADVNTANSLGVPAEPNYPHDLLRSSASTWLAGTGYHCYAGDVAAQTTLHNAYPDKAVWLTECSGWRPTGQSFAGYFADTFRWHAANVMLGATRNWAKGVITWNVALDPAGGPTNGGCGNDPAGQCSGVLAVDGSTVTRNAEFYTLGHFSRFVRPGAVRISSNDAGLVRTVAFRNPDSSIALVVHNTSGSDQQLNVVWNGQRIPYSAPADSLSTLTWTATSDTTAPTAPVVAASGTTSTSTVLSWPPATDNTAVTGYAVTRDGQPVGTTVGTTLAVRELTPATRYQFTVTAIDAAGNRSAPSAARPVTTAVTTTQGFSPGAWYSIRSAHSDKCVDDTKWGTATGTPLQQWQCGSDASRNQHWQLRDAGNGYVRVIGRHAPLLTWDIAGGTAATTAGARAQLWAPTRAANQQWRQVITGADTYAFVARHSGKCLDLVSGAVTNGARLEQQRCDGTASQSFRLTPQR